MKTKSVTWKVFQIHPDSDLEHHSFNMHSVLIFLGLDQCGHQRRHATDQCGARNQRPTRMQWFLSVPRSSTVDGSQGCFFVHHGDPRGSFQWAIYFHESLLWMNSCKNYSTRPESISTYINHHSGDASSCQKKNTYRTVVAWRQWWPKRRSPASLQEWYPTSRHPTGQRPSSCGKIRWPSCDGKKMMDGKHCILWWVYKIEWPLWIMVE